jgi:hydrogenase expression/formation protein HypE
VPKRQKVHGDIVTLAHGSGGRAMRALIDSVFLEEFGDESIDGKEDSAIIQFADLREHGDRLVFTTDAFVIDPIEFPGGDLGRLAICGTVNDLAVAGAKPLAISAAVIMEAGFPLNELRRISASMANAAEEAGVRIVTGDTKVVDRGAADKIFIATSGIGVIPTSRDLGPHRISPGDKIIVSDSIGTHGAAVMAARGDLNLGTSLASDCKPLNWLTEAVLEAAPGTRIMRDATRGGVATVLCEFAIASGLGMRIEEARLVVSDPVRGMAEILGLDPLYLANEGVFVAIVAAEDAVEAQRRLSSMPGGHAAAIIGEVSSEYEREVVMVSPFGGERLVDMLDGEQLPRIC